MMFYIKMITRSGRLRMHALTLILQTLIPRQFLPATDKRFFQQRTWDQNSKEEVPAKDEMVSTGNSDSTILYKRLNLHSGTNNSKLSAWYTTANTGSSEAKSEE